MAIFEMMREMAARECAVAKRQWSEGGNERCSYLQTDAIPDNWYGPETKQQRRLRLQREVFGK